MAYRPNNSRRGMGYGNNFGGGQNRGINPWDNGIGGGMGGGGGGGGGMRNNDAITMAANNLLSNLLRNQPGGGQVPSLLDMGCNNYNNYSGGYSDDRRMMGNRMGSASAAGRNNNNRRPNRGGGGIRKPNAVARSKNILAKNSNITSKSDSATKADNDNKNDSSTESGPQNGVGNKQNRKKRSYNEVPAEKLFCHLCAKHMYDAVSFENHLKGRTHQMMKEGIEESYRLRANMIRQEAKIAEQLKSIELDRLKRLGKKIHGSNQIREYCTMCDLNFHGHLTTHRKSDDRHLSLKKFLHPRCDDCDIEFHNRSEFDDHLLSPGHLKICLRLPVRMDDPSNRKLVISTETDETADLREQRERERKDKKKKPKEDDKAVKTEKTDKMEVDDADVKKEDGEAAETGEAEAAAVTPVEGEKKDEAEKEEPEAEPEVESPDVLLDVTEDTVIDVEIEAKLPKYNQHRAVAGSMIGKLECFECRLCYKYFDTEKTCEIHARTFNHHRNFVKYLNDRAADTKIAQKRVAAALVESERKRLKLEKEESNKKAAEENGTADDVKKEDMYDPSEATGEEDEKNDTAFFDANATEVKSDTPDTSVDEAANTTLTEEKNGDAAETAATAATTNEVEAEVEEESPNKEESPKKGRARRSNRLGTRF